jgi:hypothetical protein
VDGKSVRGGETPDPDRLEKRRYVLCSLEVKAEALHIPKNFFETVIVEPLVLCHV